MEPYVPKHCPVNEACQFSSPLITTEQFKEQCWDVIGVTEINRDVQRDKKREELNIAQELNIDEQTINELKEVCSIDNLKVIML